MSLVALFVLLFIAIFATVPIGISLGGATILTMDWFTTVSYTHLDVYKRQIEER